MVLVVSTAIVLDPSDTAISSVKSLKSFPISLMAFLGIIPERWPGTFSITVFEHVASLCPSDAVSVIDLSSTLINIPLR